MINYEFEHFKDKFFDKWLSGHSEFEFETSGSTGEKKIITLTRDQLTYSARATMTFLDPDNRIRTSLLCIRPDFIGGAMVMIRAILFDHQLTCLNPGADVISEIDSKEFDLVSLVPLQVQKIIEVNPEYLFRFKSILTGGAPLSRQVEDVVKKTGHIRMYHTYGMTETASHIAIRKVGYDDIYQALGDVELRTDNESRLQIRGSVTNKEWIRTNDMVELTDRQSFKWLGRSDHVINTGGIKVIPEEVEKLLKHQIQAPFFVAGLPDHKLGSQVTLIVETVDSMTLKDLDLSSIPKYHRPKQLLTLPKFIYTETNKLQRSQTLELIPK